MIRFLVLTIVFPYGPWIEQAFLAGWLALCRGVQGAWRQATCEAAMQHDAMVAYESPLGQLDFVQARLRGSLHALSGHSSWPY